jgi:hypothetical protein
MCVRVCHRHKWKLSEHVADCDQLGGGEWRWWSAAGATFSALRLSLAVKIVNATPNCVLRMCFQAYRAQWSLYEYVPPVKHSTVLPTQCMYVFCVDLRTNSDYFPIQH